MGFSLKRFWGKLRRQISKDIVNSRGKSKKGYLGNDLMTEPCPDRQAIASYWLKDLTESNSRCEISYLTEGSSNGICFVGRTCILLSNFKGLETIKAWEIKQGVII